MGGQNGPGIWNELIRTLPNAHLLQTSRWADFKSQYGWVPYYLLWFKDPGGWRMKVLEAEESLAIKPDAAGLLLERKAFPGLSVFYMPKGPLIGDWSDQGMCEKVLDDLIDFAEQRGGLQLKIDPAVELGVGVPGGDDFREIQAGIDFQELLRSHGWVFSQEQIQFRNTVLVDLQADEDQILARMKSKTRYNIRLSGRKGIQVRFGTVDDLPSLYRMYAGTSQRAGFTIRDESYYLTLWESFMREGEDPCAQPIVADFEGEPVAGAVIFKFGSRAWYLHGMSNPEHSEKMAPHLLQWEAMRWAKSQGCDSYDMWGAPDRFQESDSLWGVYRFKRGFGGNVSLTIGAWDYPVRPLIYAAYNRWLPRILDIARWFGDRRTARAAQP